MLARLGLFIAFFAEVSNELTGTVRLDAIRPIINSRLPAGRPISRTHAIHVNLGMSFLGHADDLGGEVAGAKRDDLGMQFIYETLNHRHAVGLAPELAFGVQFLSL